MLMGRTHWMSCLNEMKLETDDRRQEKQLVMFGRRGFSGALAFHLSASNQTTKIKDKWFWQRWWWLITSEFPHLARTCGTCTWSLVGKPNHLNFDHLHNPSQKLSLFDSLTVKAVLTFLSAWFPFCDWALIFLNVIDTVQFYIHVNYIYKVITYMFKHVRCP